MDFLQELSQVYLSMGIPLEKSFDDYVEEMRKDFVRKIKHDAVCLKLLEKARKKYPKYPCHIRFLGDGGEALVLYYVKEEKEVKKFLRKYLDEICPEGDFDLSIDTKPPDITETFYKNTVDEIKYG